MAAAFSGAVEPDAAFRAAATNLTWLVGPWPLSFNDLDRSSPSLACGRGVCPVRSLMLHLAPGWVATGGCPRFLWAAERVAGRVQSVQLVSKVSYTPHHPPSRALTCPHTPVFIRAR